MDCEIISPIIALGVNIAVIVLGSCPEKFEPVNFFGFSLHEKVPLQSIFHTFLWILTVLNIIIVICSLGSPALPERVYNTGNSRTVIALSSEMIWSITTLFILLVIGSARFILIILALKVLVFLIFTMCGGNPERLKMAGFIEIGSRCTLVITGFFSIQMEAVNLFGFNLAAGFTKRSVFGTCLIVFASPSALISLVDLFQRGKSEVTAKIYIRCEVISSIFYLIPLLTLGSIGFILSVLPLKGFVILLKNCCADLPESEISNPTAATRPQAQSSSLQNANFSRNPNNPSVSRNNQSTRARESDPLIHGRETRTIRVYNIDEGRYKEIKVEIV
jgi:hypothetical protein